MPYAESTASRKTVNKQLRHDSMRAKISFTKTWTKLESLEDELHALTKPQKVIQGGEMVEIIPNPPGSIIAALKTLIESNWKKIDRLLPPLKAIDSSAANELGIAGDEAPSMMSRIELRQHIKHMLSGVDTLEPEPRPALPAPEPELPDFLK